MARQTIVFPSLESFTAALSPERIPAFRSSVERALAGMLAVRLPDSLRKAVPKRTGKLASSFVGSSSGPTVNIRNSLPYASFVRFQQSGLKVESYLVPESNKLLKRRGTEVIRNVLSRFTND